MRALKCWSISFFIFWTLAAIQFFFFVHPSIARCESSFNPIDAVKSEIPSEYEGTVWYNSHWRQKVIDAGTWEVYVSGATFKVSTHYDLCSDGGRYVSVCCENGTARSYSNLPYCRPSSICDKAETRATVDISKEQNQIDLSELSYVPAERDGWKYTKVVGIPEGVRRAISLEVTEYEQRNPNATTEDTCRALGKRHGLPEKAVKAIYFEGCVKNW